VVVIYAGVNGYLDPIPVSAVRKFEDGLLRMMREDAPDILDAIRNEKQISDDTGARLKAAVEGYAKRFTP
jgi:F-type H+-transporting ATPase subunit alpha